MTHLFRVLLVEDNDIMQRVMSFVLSDLKCDVDIAKDGETAIELFQHHHYDLIFMDIGLPGLDGLEATQIIRRLEEGKTHIPIVGHTAHLHASDRNSCLEKGMDEFVLKPVTREMFKAIIDKFLVQKTVGFIDHTFPYCEEQKNIS